MEPVTPKEYRYGSPTDVHGVPVTVVDLVPVTAIDLPEDYGNTVTDSVTKTLPRHPSTFSNGNKNARNDHNMCLLFYKKIYQLKSFINNE